MNIVTILQYAINHPIDLIGFTFQIGFISVFLVAIMRDVDDTKKGSDGITKYLQNKIFFVIIYALMVTWFSGSLIYNITTQELLKNYSTIQKRGDVCTAPYRFEMMFSYREENDSITDTRCFSSKEIGEILGFSEW